VNHVNQTPIFLDHQASTPLDPSVLAEMLPWLSEPANPHSNNVSGRRAAQAIEGARTRVAELIGVSPDELFFTSGATEAANITMNSFAAPGARIVTSSIEHACVLEPLRVRERETDVFYVPSDAFGIIDVESLADALEVPANLVCVMAVNNEIGTIQPIDEIGALCSYSNVPFFCDLTQAAGRVDVDLQRARVAMAALSSHKIYGPQGIGAFYVSKDLDVKLAPLGWGGGQENGLRAGTLPTALCVGFGAAADLARKQLEVDRSHVEKLATCFLASLRAEGLTFEINGSHTDRVPHNLNISIEGIDADALVASMNSVSISTGSACHSGALAPSHVLEAIGLDLVRQQEAVRIGFGRHNTPDEVVAAAGIIGDACRVQLAKKKSIILKVRQ